MLFHVCVFAFVTIFFCSPVSCSDYTEACDAVFDPENMKILCCEPINQHVERVIQCQKQSCSDVYTCSIAQCTLNLYGVLTTDNTTIIEAKIRPLFKRLSKMDPESKPLNDRVVKNCLNGQYKKYITSDPDCDTMKYLTCAYVNFLMGCQEFNKSQCSCKRLSENVATCKPHLKQYLKQINNN